MAKKKSPQRSKSPRGLSPIPAAPTYDLALSSLTLFAEDGAQEVLQPRSLELPTKSRNRVPLPPGSTWVKLRAVARNKYSTVRIYRMDKVGVSKDAQRDVETLQWTICRPQPSPSVGVVSHVQRVVRGWLARVRFRARSVVDGKLQMAPPPSSVWSRVHIAAQPARAALERWFRAQQLHDASQGAPPSSKGKKTPGLRSMLLREHELALREAVQAIPLPLVKFLRANILAIEACVSKHLNEQDVQDDGFVDSAAFEGVLKELGLSSAIITPAFLWPLYFGTMGITPKPQSGRPGKIRYTNIKHVLLFGEEEMRQDAEERLALFGAPHEPDVVAAEAAAAKAQEGKEPAGKKGSGKKSPKKGGGKSPKKEKDTKSKGSKSKSPKGGRSASPKPSGESEEELKELAVMEELYPESVATFRVVVMAEDFTCRTYEVDVHIAPVITLPPLPETLRPVLSYIMHYHGDLISWEEQHGVLRTLAQSADRSFVQSDLLRQHAAAIASGTASTGEYAMGYERFVACCHTLRLAVSEVARLSFLMVSRERPSALLGPSATWAALVFCFARSLSSKPLALRAPHRWTFDNDAITALAMVKLKPVQYNLDAVASVASRIMPGESAIPEQMSCQDDEANGGEAAHYLMSGKLNTGLQAVLASYDAEKSMSIWTTGWSLVRERVFGNSITRVIELANRWSVHGLPSGREERCAAQAIEQQTVRVLPHNALQPDSSSMAAHGLKSAQDSIQVDTMSVDSPRDHADPSLYTTRQPLHMFLVTPTAARPRAPRPHSVVEIGVTALRRRRSSTRLNVAPLSGRPRAGSVARPETKSMPSRVPASAASEKIYQVRPAWQVAPAPPPQGQLDEIEQWAMQQFPPSSTMHSKRLSSEPRPLPPVPTLTDGKESSEAREYLTFMRRRWAEPRLKEAEEEEEAGNADEVEEGEVEAGEVEEDDRDLGRGTVAHAGNPSPQSVKDKEGGCLEITPGDQTLLQHVQSKALATYAEQRFTLPRPWYTVPGLANFPPTYVRVSREIWHTRKNWCDGKDLHDHDAVIQQRFINDWRITISLGAANLILNHDKKVEARMETHVPIEVEEAGAVLLMNHPFLVLVFYLYSKACTKGARAQAKCHCHRCAHDIVATQTSCPQLLVSADSHDVPRFTGDNDLHIMASKGWTMLLTNCTIVDEQSGFYTLERADEIFEQVLSRSDEHTTNGISRPQFLLALIHLAIDKYMRTGELAHVSGALERLCGLIKSNLCSETIEPGMFRRDYAYTPEVSAVLIRHESSLRVIFGGLDGMSRTPGSLISLTAWRTLLRGVGFLGLCSQ